MTTIARGPWAARPRIAPARKIDVRCSAELPREADHEGRCQLFAGHDGPHAVMFTHGGTRLVRTWKRSNPAAAADHESGALQRPWMYGFPAPAWFETDVESAS